MRHRYAWAVVISALLFASLSASALSIVTQDPHWGTYEMFTTEPVVVRFSANVAATSVNPQTFYVTTKADPETQWPGVLSVDGDTVTFSPVVPFVFGTRYLIHITSGLHAVGGDPFDGVYTYGDQFVANIPNDLDRPAFDPLDPIPAFANANVLLGFNPGDPEGTDESHPEMIPGMSATEAWKYTIGRPDVVIAVVDNGMERYWYEETMDNFFLNRGELPLPNVGGTPCPDYDCNADGRFNVRDYDADDRIPPPDGHPISPAELIDTFSDAVDDDGNGLADDICGWDFLRNVNEALGVREFDEGAHGEDRARDAAGIADNGVGDKPGFCPNCTILPIRTSDAIMGEYNSFGRGVQYAMELGANVVVAASGTPDYARSVDDIIAEAYDENILVVAASGDELGFHHSYPASSEDVLSVKSIFPMPPIRFYGIFPIELIAFVETYCTNYGSHIHVAGSSGACSSEATGNLGGAAGLLISRARDLGIELTANEIKQLLTMTADDIYERCLTLTGGGCKEGWDEHFGYGRPNLKRAILALGDVERAIPERIPPEARITSPRWFKVYDPLQTPSIPIDIDVYARDRAYAWTLEWATGAEPDDSEFVQFATGGGTERFAGEAADLNLASIHDEAYLRKLVEHPNDFTVWVRLRVTYDGEGQTVLGEHRKTIALKTDDDPLFGLIDGFPRDIGASGESSPLLYDLDGADNGNLELIFGTSDGTVEAWTYDEETGAYVDVPGFPVSIRVDPSVGVDLIVGTAAVGDLLGDGVPKIVVTTGAGAVFAIHNDGTEHDGGPFLEGFPVWAAEPPNDSSYIYGHGRSFGSSPVLADLDLDGRLEILATNYDGHVYGWRPIDVDADGYADDATGFPVLAQSTVDQVEGDKWCPGEDGEEQRPAQILATPAVGILDPNDADPDLSEYPVIIVPTTEVCHEGTIATGRVYAIHHDGTANASGSPFVEGFPVVMDAPLSGALPIPPLTIGITSSPAMAHHYTGETLIGITPFAWFPQMIRYEAGEIRLQMLASEVSINGAGHVSFAKMNGDDNLFFVMPTLSGFKEVDGWISLLRPLLMTWLVDDPSTPVVKQDLEDIHFFINPVVADIDGDGLQEAIAGSSGFAAHAVNNLGVEPPTWPKFTYNWIIASPAVGDANGDGVNEIFWPTHEGNVYAWNTTGPACVGDGLNAQWRKFHNDEWNTGVYGADTLPPAMIVDLEANYDEGGWVLTWTSVGDDWTCGVGAGYDIRYSEDPDDLRGGSAFGRAEPVPVSVPIPLPAGTRQELRVPLLNEDLYFAVRTQDENGLLAHPSIIAPTPPDPDDDDDEHGDDDDDEACGCDAAGGGGGLGVLFVLIAGILLFAIIHRKESA